MMTKVEVNCGRCSEPFMAWAIDGLIPYGCPLCNKCMRDSFKDIPEPIMLRFARGNGKSGMAMEYYRMKLGIPDDEWAEMKREVEKKMFGGDCDE